ncbi:MAG TPA: sensor histidine kinase, partial [Pseudonocardiaceae bacterium]|nr:sensor histidine kinase [Pseudonocardiaceae bacterium]
AVVNAQRQERLRELSIVDERTRIARDLHDSVTQTLFSLTLAAESAATVAGAGSPAYAHLDRVRDLSRTALDELRALVDTLRPPDVDREGLGVALRKRVDLLRAVHDVPILLEVHGREGRHTGEVGCEVLKVANEAIGNALQHASPHRIRVRLDVSVAVRLTVSDDGSGFDLAVTARTSRRLGLASMRERAETLGGTLQVDTAPGAGTTVTLEVPTG